jgi:S1-C subfamily serine protease
MLLDALIIIGGLSALYRGRDSGFVRQGCSAIGFFGGLMLGGWLQPHTVNLTQTTNARALLLVTTTLGCALIGLTIGEYVGLNLKRRFMKRQLNHVDNGLGSVLGIVSLLISVWLLAAIATGLPAPEVKAAVRSSTIITELNRLLPPAPTVIGKLGHLIDPNGFPDVFIGNEPIPRGDVRLPALGDLAAAVNADKDSVVRIKGQGCGGVVSGSGFVARDGLVATNAHVVAGINKPFVQDANGSHVSQVVWFDPDLDLAVLRTGNLAGAPLALRTDAISPGTPGAVLGYPGGGAFQAAPAAVLDQLRARGRNIYGEGNTLRNIYEVQADVIPGNSGGPLVDKSGRIIGVIFAESTTYNHVGYALTANQVNNEIKQAANNRQPVSSGRCAE